jgi:hypothetical protein
MVAEDVPDAFGAGGSDPLVDLQRLPQVSGAFAGRGADTASPESFQGSCFLDRAADLTGDLERHRVMAMGGMRVLGRSDRAQVVERLRLTHPVPEVAVEFQRLAECGGRCR